MKYSKYNITLWQCSDHLQDARVSSLVHNCTYE